jgi:hypothetical protein
VPRRPHLTLVLLVLLVLPAAGGLLAACGASAPPPGPPPADRAACSGLVAALPATIGGSVVHTTAAGASWGSMSLRCGVGRPQGFQATSECLTVDRVDWFAPPGWYDDPGADVDLTTVSLTPRVVLHVPAKDRGGAAAAALADLAPVLRMHLKTTKRCQ